MVSAAGVGVPVGVSTRVLLNHEKENSAQGNEEDHTGDAGRATSSSKGSMVRAWNRVTGAFSTSARPRQGVFAGDVVEEQGTQGTQGG